MTASTERALRALVETVLYEGYVLYPYGARSGSNHLRFQWGVLGPPGADADGACESPTARVECVLEADASAEVEVTVRFLQTQERTLERHGVGVGVEVAELVVDGELLLPWTEACEHERTLGPVAVAALTGRGYTAPIAIDGGDEVEDVVDAAGGRVGRVRRRRWPLTAAAVVTAEPGDLDGRLWRIAVEVDNRADRFAGGGRDEALRHALVATHVVLRCRGGRFLSSQDPPDRGRDAAAACRSDRLWPVLVGDPATDDTVLASPIILYDHPELAPESPGDLFDATEIDELLTLRVMTLTDEEKREARATDPRAARIVDRADTLPPEILERLHGAVRSLGPALPVGADPTPATTATCDPALPTMAPDAPWWDPAVDASVSPGTDTVDVGGVAISSGSRVRLAPSRRADAQDLFLAGQDATVHAVVHDVDGGTHLAVTVDDDPAADLHDWYGRYLYFGPDEVQPLDEEPAP